MARPVVLGNGSLTVGLNENGLVQDFYYPYVGLENLTTARSEPHHIGVWVDGEFSWLNSNDWTATVDFSDEYLISKIKYISDKLNLIIDCSDFVDHHYNVFARKMIINNTSSHVRQVRVFYHQVFQISALGRADTAMYVPEGNYMMDYKGRCSILAYAESSDGVPFDQYAAGNAGIEGKAGTFKDAEDGELSMSPVEHGGVDSTIRCTTVIGPHMQKEFHYWLAVADSQLSLQSLHKVFLREGFTQRLEATRQHWIDWLKTARINLPPDMDIAYSRAVMKSLMIIKAHTDSHGGIIASCDSSIYNYGRDYYSYVWPRDGAFVIWPLLKLGYTHEAKRFFDFCAHIQHPDGYMMHKYQPDRAIGSTWHPLVHGKSHELAIQEDETAILLIMLAEYEKYSGDSQYVDSLYEKFIKPAANFMNGYIDTSTGLPHASYDLWEEKFMTHTYTSATVQAALVSASAVALRNSDNYSSDMWLAAVELIAQNSQKFVNTDNGSYIKGFFVDGERAIIDNTLDVSSFYGMWKFAPNQQLDALTITLRRIETELLGQSPSWGSPRYEMDNYFSTGDKFKGNPWFVTTLWLGQYYCDNNRKVEAKHCIDWALAHTLHSGSLSEQVHPETGEHISVTPLVWSHAELINIIVAYSS